MGAEVGSDRILVAASEVLDAESGPAGRLSPGREPPAGWRAALVFAWRPAESGDAETADPAPAPESPEDASAEDCSAEETADLTAEVGQMKSQADTSAQEGTCQGEVTPRALIWS